MGYQKALLAAVLISGFVAGGCAANKRIEGNEVPLEPQTNDVTMPPEAAPPAPAPEAEAPPPPEEPTPVPTPEAQAPPPPPQVQAQAPPPPPEATPNPCRDYIVVKGDTLWGISGSSSGYNDYFLWPLIFKANRDQITDPDLIYPKQDFCIRQDFEDKDKQKARKDASDTPKYVPHTKPRETLPVDYF